MPVDERILLTLMKLDANQVDLGMISQEAMLSQDVVLNTLRKLADDRLIQLDEGLIWISPRQRLGLAILALKKGVDVERV